MGCKLLEPVIELGYILVIVGVGVDAFPACVIVNV